MTTEIMMERSAAPAVTRAVAILDLLAEARGAVLSLSDIARALGIAKSSTSNLCAALEAGGLIRRSESGYALGRKTVELGGAYLRTFDQVREFYRVCALSRVLSRELLQLAVLDGREVIYLARHEGRTPLRLSATIGDRLPASVTAMGNALLATLTPAEVDERFADLKEWPRLTDKSVTSLKGLHDKLDRVREQGYAYDDGEVFSGVVGLAVALPARTGGDARIAIGASMFKPDDTQKHRSAVVSELRRACELLQNPMVPIAGTGPSSDREPFVGARNAE
jgi:DNA-binding IclR family transcriptional regulator